MMLFLDMLNCTKRYKCIKKQKKKKKKKNPTNKQTEGYMQKLALFKFCRYLLFPHTHKNHICQKNCSLQMQKDVKSEGEKNQKVEAF